LEIQQQPPSDVPEPSLSSGTPVTVSDILSNPSVSVQSDDQFTDSPSYNSSSDCEDDCLTVSPACSGLSSAHSELFR